MFYLTFNKFEGEHTVIVAPYFVPKHVPFTMIGVLDWLLTDTGNGGMRDWLFEQIDQFGDLLKIEKA